MQKISFTKKVHECLNIQKNGLQHYEWLLPSSNSLTMLKMMYTMNSLMLQHTCGRQEALGNEREGGQKTWWPLHPRQSLDKTPQEVRNHHPIWSILPVFLEYRAEAFRNIHCMNVCVWKESTAGLNMPFNVHNGLTVHQPLQINHVDHLFG